MAPRSKQASVTSVLRDDSASLPALVVPRLLRIQDAAKYLSATTWQVETLLREKTIPSFVLGKRRVIDRLELDRYVERRNAEAKSAAEKASRTPDAINRAVAIIHIEQTIEEKASTPSPLQAMETEVSA
jgi:excisionase family DNA binding protein